MPKFSQDGLNNHNHVFYSHLTDTI